MGDSSERPPGDFGDGGDASRQGRRARRRQSGQLLADSHRREIRHSSAGSALTSTSVTIQATDGCESSMRSLTKRAVDRVSPQESAVYNKKAPCTRGTLSHTAYA